MFEDRKVVAEKDAIIHEEKDRDGKIIKKAYFLENVKFSAPVTINGTEYNTCESAIRAIAEYINGNERKGE